MSDHETEHISQSLARVQPKQGSEPIKPPARNFCDAVEFNRAMDALCYWKRTAIFTGAERVAWYAVLGGFKIQTINRAMIQTVASTQRFPEVSDLWQECRRIEPPDVPYNAYGEGPPKERLTDGELREIAGRIGLEV